MLFIFGIASCNIDTVENPNGPTIESYANDASATQLQLLTTGLEAAMRNDMEFYYWTTSIVGREYNDLNGTDPRYTGEILGAGDGEGVLDNNGFLTTRSFAARYRVIRNAENLITAVQNSNAGLDNAGKAGYYAFAKTVEAYQMLLTLNRQYNNGVRLDVADPDNLGPFVSYEEGLTGIASLLTSALEDASNAGDSFTFSLSGGFAGFDTPSTFATFINALLARVKLYQGDKAGVRAALAGSFLDMMGDLSTGPKHVFSGSGNDRLNPLFNAPGQAKYMALNDFASSIEANDDRINKVAKIDTVTIDGITSDLQVQIYGSNTEAVDIIRNEELILIAAEANIGFDNAGAVAAINLVRSAHGLADYSGGQNDADLVNEILHQRRYSLFGEGHRWVDMRRYNRLGDLPLERSGDQVFVQFPRPVLDL